MIADHRMAPTGIDQMHRQTQHVRGTRPPVHQIPQQDRLAALRMGDVVLAVTFRSVSLKLVAQCFEQDFQLAGTAVNITDQIERTQIIKMRIRRQR